jgi:hypothetical protein
VSGRFECTIVRVDPNYDWVGVSGRIDCTIVRGAFKNMIHDT